MLQKLADNNICATIGISALTDSIVTEDDDDDDEEVLEEAVLEEVFLVEDFIFASVMNRALLTVACFSSQSEAACCISFSGG